MKKSKYIYILLVIFGLTSCLDEDPQYSINKETLFEDYNGAVLALEGCYGYLTTYDAYGQAMQELMSGASGIAWCQTNGGDQDQYASLDASVTCTITNMAFRGLYQTISACNLFITNADNGTLNEVQKTYLVAQARFLRGFCYLELVNIWGGVPLRLDAPVVESVNCPRASKEEVIAQIEKDFRYAAENLPAIQSEDDKISTPTRYAAYAYLAKMYFLLGSNDNTSDSPYWKLAKVAGDSVIEKGNYDLENDFGRLFEASNKHSVESIFQLNFSLTSSNTGNRGSWLFAPQNVVTDAKSWARVRSTKAFHDLFKGTNMDDPRYKETFCTQWINVTNKDKSASYPCKTKKGLMGTTVTEMDYTQFSDPTNPDLSELSETDAEAYNNAFINKGGDHQGWPMFKKAMDPNQGPQNSNKNLIVYRYADFLLLMADVYNELDMKSEAIKFVNKVRLRARTSGGANALTPKDMIEPISKDEITNQIYYERLFELAGEPEQYIDVRRRGVEKLKEIVMLNNNHKITRANAESQLNNTHNFKDRILLGGNITDDLLRKNLHLPIPQNELNGNASISSNDQNFGY